MEGYLVKKGNDSEEEEAAEGKWTYVRTNSLRITVAACCTVTRKAVTVGSRHLTTASANLGKLVYNTNGF